MTANYTTDATDEAKDGPPTTTPLTDDFPGVKALRKAGVETIQQLREIEDVTTIDGIGEGTAKEIAAKLAD